MTAGDQKTGDRQADLLFGLHRPPPAGELKTIIAFPTVPSELNNAIVLICAPLLWSPYIEIKLYEAVFTRLWTYKYWGEFSDVGQNGYNFKAD